MNFESNGAGFLPNDNQEPQHFPGVKNFFVNGGVGSDAYDGSRNNPFATIGRAIMAAEDWSGKNNVIVDPGNYHESLTIEDFGGIMIRGRQINGEKVNINSAGDFGLNIKGGSTVDLRNLNFRYGSTGIYATDLEHLKIHNVLSNQHSSFGLSVDSVENVHVSASTFSNNGATGARVAYVDHLKIFDTYLQSNAHNGAAVFESSNAELTKVYASSNGLMNSEILDDGPQAAVFDSGYGIAASGNESVVIRRSHLRQNELDGGHFVDNGNVALYTVNAYENLHNGIGGHGNMSVIVRDGQYRDNDENGVEINGYSGRAALGLSEPVDFALRVIGGSFLDNGDEGLYAENLDSVNLRGLNVQRNENDGVDVVESRKLYFNGIYTAWNGDDGVDLDDVYSATLNNVTAINNYGDGLDVDGAHQVDTSGGDYSRNQEDGLDIDDVQKRVNIRHAIAAANQRSGLTIDRANTGAIVGGRFNSNQQNGIWLNDVGRMTVKNATGYDNGWNGFLSTAVNEKEQLSTAQYEENGHQYYFGGLDVSQSFFNHNGQNGFQVDAIGIVQNEVSGLYGGNSVYQFYLNLDRVIAKKNDGSGVVIGGEPGNATNGNYQRSNGHIEIDVDFNFGYFGHNGGDGIRMSTGASLTHGYDIYGDVNLFRSIAESNGGNGVSANLTGNRGQNDNPSDAQSLVANGDHHDYGNLNLNLERAVLNGNDYDGIRVSALGTTDEGGDNGFGGSFPTVTADHVIANRNGQHGLNYYYERIANDVRELPAAQAFQPVYEELPLIHVIGGTYNNNEYDGLNVDIQTNSYGNGSIGYTSWFDDVSAISNGRNGLSSSAHGSEPYAPDYSVRTYINGGHFNANTGDGLFIYEMGGAYLNGVHGIANKDNGIETIDVGTLELGDSTFVANQGGNINSH